MELEETVDIAIRELESAQNFNRKQFLRIRKQLIGDFCQEEWILFMRKWQKQHKEEYPIPEFIGYKEIRKIAGEAIYTTFDIGPGNPQELLKKIFEGYGILDEKKSEVFIKRRDKSTRRYLQEAFFPPDDFEKKEKNTRFLLQYAWKQYWELKYQISELITYRDIRERVGDAVYASLEKALEGYGVFTEEKCQIFLEKREKAQRNTLCKAFFSNKKYATRNAEFLVVYAWNHLWKSTYSIPEFMDATLMYKMLGKKVYEAFDVNLGNSTGLFQKVFRDYSILTDEKSRYYLEHDDKETRQEMTKIFLAREHGVKNARTLLHYTWEHRWNKEYNARDEITELRIRETLGEGIYSALDLPGGDFKNLLAHLYKIRRKQPELFA